jgi:hypothetical protein
MLLASKAPDLEKVAVEFAKRAEGPGGYPAHGQDGGDQRPGQQSQGIRADRYLVIMRAPSTMDSALDVQERAWDAVNLNINCSS